MGLSEADVRRALVVSAHPDDVDFGAAGTVAAWTAAGIEVAYCVCTSGEATGSMQTPRGETAALRESEQRAAAAEVGVDQVFFLHYQDGALCPSLELRKDITRVIRSFRPDRVLGWSPEINWERIVTAHPDHRAAGEATLAAVYPDARNPHTHRSLLLAEGLQPWTVRELWLADAPAALRNHAVDVTETFTAKIAALRAHRSQTGQMDGLEDGIRDHLAANAARHGLGPGRLAEEFQLVNTS
jgi:LmbE family N-acetylglucosaminyl deacetylase